MASKILKKLNEKHITLVAVQLIKIDNKIDEALKIIRAKQ